MIGFVYIIHTHTHTASALSRGESRSDATNSLTDGNSGWFWQLLFFLLNYTRASLGLGVVLLKMHLSAFCAAFYLYVWFVDRTLSFLFWCY